jgi:allophanate hydrolase subunit 1
MTNYKNFTTMWENKKPRESAKGGQAVVLLLKSFGWGLFQQHHLPNLYKLSCLYLVKIHTSTNWFVIIIGSIPDN